MSSSSTGLSEAARLFVRWPSGPRLLAPFLSALAAFAPGLTWACATCGCTLSADAAMGYTALPGLRLNFEYDYINQDRLRSGTASASFAQVVNTPSDPTLGGGEIEKQTINRYLSLGVSYSPNSRWNVNLLVPHVTRTHTTYGQQATPFHGTLHLTSVARHHPCQPSRGRR